jgi:hypothetical protein
MMAAAGAEPKPWERMPGESGPAYAAFLAYRDMGATRSYVATARSLRRHESLIRRWATRRRWQERAWRWDVQQAGQDEAAVRQHRDGVLRERLEDLDRMGRACLAFFRTMIRRDPATGEVTFDTRFTPQVALRFLELVLKAQGAFDQPRHEDKADERPAADLFGLADAELMELIELARERADQQGLRQETNGESDQGTTREEQHKEEKDQQDGAEGR